jgi:hypothetical protein
MIALGLERERRQLIGRAVERGKRRRHGRAWLAVSTLILAQFVLFLPLLGIECGGEFAKLASAAVLAHDATALAP